MVAKCNSKAWHSGPGPTEVEEARRPGIQGVCGSLPRSSRHMESTYGIRHRSSYQQPASTDGGRKRRKQSIGMAPSGGLGLHRVTQASRVAGSGHVKTPPYVQLQLQRQRSHLLQACKPPVSLSCLRRLPRLHSRGIAAKLPGSTAARREQERGKRQAKMRKSENGASWLWERESVGVGSWCCIAKCALGFVLRFSLAKLHVDVVLWC